MVASGVDGDRTISVARDGTFRIAGLPAGDYRIHVLPFHAKVAGRWLGGESRDTATVYTVDGVLELGDISGVGYADLDIALTHPDGSPVADGVGMLSDKAGHVFGSAQADASGHLQMAAPPGTYELLVGSAHDPADGGRSRSGVRPSLTWNLPGAARVGVEVLDDQGRATPRGPSPCSTAMGGHGCRPRPIPTAATSSSASMTASTRSATTTRTAASTCRWKPFQPRTTGDDPDSGVRGIGGARVDETPPMVASVVGAEGTDGWYRSDVEVSWTVDDPESAITAAVGCDPVTVLADTAGADFTCQASSAGGITVESVTVKRDAAAPILEGTPVGPPNGAGWYKSDVAVSWACSDALSGIAEGACAANSVLTGEGAGLVAKASVSDRAGNLTQADSAAVSIDRTAPVTTATAPDGWSGSDVTVELAATDGLSGVASTSWSLDGSTPTEGISVPISGDGKHVLMFFSVDKAGNAEKPVTIEVRLDASGPIVTHRVSPEPNAAGWNRQPVTVHFECSDPGAGVATCPEDVTVSAEGSGQVVSGEAIDAAGKRTVDHVVVNLDLTVPVVSGALAEEPNAAGWYRNPVAVTWTCTDALSGVADCPDPVTLTEAASGPVEGTVTDVAGNTATARVGPVKIDTTPPTVDLTGFTDGATYLLSAAPTPRCTASDAGSGLAGECTVTLTGGTTGGLGELSVTAVARDVAGNSTAVTTRYEVAYRWTGFLSPISSTGISTFTAGSAVPVKFTLTDADGNVVQPGSAPQWLTPQRGPKIGKPLTTVVLGEPQPSGKTFTRSDQSWQYNWKTTKADRGYYWRIGVRLDNGEVYQVWIAVK